MQYFKLENELWVACEESELQNGDKYKLITDSGAEVVSYYSRHAALPSYAVANEQITINGLPAQKTLSGDYDSEIGDNITIEFTLVDGEAINYGDAVLKIPMVRYAGDKQTDSEIYLSATIKNGIVFASGSTVYGGNWRLIASRINSALSKINAGWEVDSSTQDIVFLV